LKQSRWRLSNALDGTGGRALRSLLSSRHAGRERGSECAYVEGDGQYARFFSQPLLLGKNVEERQSIGKLSAFEQQALEGMLDTLKKDIALGEDFVNK
jgi:malate/lactate dehydrogenase